MLAGAGAREDGAPLVLLEDPRDLGNLGACVRVAAAADAAAVLTTGGHDPWHPDALRGSAGLHYALAVARLPDALAPALDRPLLALHPAGDPLDPAALPPRAVLAFGTERHGLSPELLARADARIAIPMRPGVSSLNLATSVAAVLFAWRLSHGTPAGRRRDGPPRGDTMPAAREASTPSSSTQLPRSAACARATIRSATASASSSARPAISVSISSPAWRACSTSRRSCRVKYSTAGPSAAYP